MYLGYISAQNNDTLNVYLKVISLRLHFHKTMKHAPSSSLGIMISFIH